MASDYPTPGQELRAAEWNFYNAEDKPAALTNYICTRRRVA